jgi:hypothetical protein
MADEFQLVAGHVALDFANTLGYRYYPDRLIVRPIAGDQVFFLQDLASALKPGDRVSSWFRCM